MFLNNEQLESLNIMDFIYDFHLFKYGLRTMAEMVWKTFNSLNILKHFETFSNENGTFSLMFFGLLDHFPIQTIVLG
jgi:hypothetical protein